MANILIRDLDVTTVTRLKARAAANGRSLQTEVKEIIERSAREQNLERLRREAEAFAKRFAGRKMTDSVLLQREGRRA